MYSEKMVVAIKTNGKILREQGNKVYLPFGAEYSIYLRNLNSVRACVTINIDGKNATEGTLGIIVPAFGCVDIERFITNGNMEKGNRFKFIERTEKIENGPRGIKAEDGLISIQFEYEVQPVHLAHSKYWSADEYAMFRGAVGANSADLMNVDYSTQSSTRAMKSAPTSAALTSSASAGPRNDVGITVPGSVSEQKFTASSFVSSGTKHVTVMHLVGQVNETVVVAPVTTKTQQECPTCGTKNKFGTKFCRECGTSLTLF